MKSVSGVNAYHDLLSRLRTSKETRFARDGDAYTFSEFEAYYGAAALRIWRKSELATSTADVTEHGDARPDHSLQGSDCA